MVLLMASAAMFANGGKESAAVNEGGVQKLYWYAWTNPANMEALIAEFNEDYAGKYELVYQKMADASTMTINTALASGEPMHIMTQASAFDLRQRAESGVYLGLKKFFDQEGTTYKEVFGESIEETQNINGEYYSIPYNQNINMVFFNKSMFDDAGVAYPDPDWTWDDFRETAKKLTSGSGANKVYGAMLDVAAPNGDMYWATIAQQKLGTFWYYSDDFKTTRFDEPAMEESLQFFYDLFQDGTCVPLSEYTALKYNTDSVGMNGLYSGRYAMWIAPVYGCLYLNSSYGEIPAGTDIGMANVPRPVDVSKPVTTSYTSQTCIPVNTPDEEASWILMKYANIDHPILFAGQKAMHPGFQFKTKAEADAFNEIIFNKPGLDKSMAMEIMALPRTIVSRDNTHLEGQAKINDLINANISLVFNGEMTVRDALKDLKQKGDKFIEADMK